jgi:hypothetical protein
MSQLDAYLGRIPEAFDFSIPDRLTSLERGEVEHLIEHGEPTEG